MKLLLVDDDEDIRKIGQLSLSAVGKFLVTTAASAEEALALARADLPDLILMDLMMPGKDGVAALTELRRDPQLEAIPVLFMTARVQPGEVSHYLRLGAAGVIQKPFDPMTLPSQVRQLMGSRVR